MEPRIINGIESKKNHIIPVKKEKEAKIIPQKKHTPNTSRVVTKSETNYLKKAEKKPLMIKKSIWQKCEPPELDFFERVKEGFPNSMLKNERDLMNDLENQETCFLKNNCMPLELEFSNPQIKNFYKPQVKVLQEKKNKEENLQKTRNKSFSKIERSENKSKIELGIKQTQGI